MKKQVVQLACALGLIMSVQTAQGQVRGPVEIGFHGGAYLNDAAISGLNFNTGDFLMPKSTLGYSVGVRAKVPLGRNISLVPELNYSQRGAAISEGLNLDLFGVDVPLGAEVRSRVNYIDLPVKLQYEFGNGGVKGFVNAGPMVSYATSAKLETRLKTFIEIPIHTFNLDMGGNWANRVELSGVAGAGVSIPAGKGNLILEGQYIHGFTDVFETPIIDVGLQNRSFGFRIGYTIPIGGKSIGRIDKA